MNVSLGLRLLGAISVFALATVVAVGLRSSDEVQADNLDMIRSNEFYMNHSVGESLATGAVKNEVLSVGLRVQTEGSHLLVDMSDVRFIAPNLGGSGWIHENILVMKPTEDEILKGLSFKPRLRSLPFGGLQAVINEGWEQSQIDVSGMRATFVGEEASVGPHRVQLGTGPFAFLFDESQPERTLLEAWRQDSKGAWIPLVPSGQ